MKTEMLKSTSAAPTTGTVERVSEPAPSFTPGPWFVNGPWHIQAGALTELPVIVAQVTRLRDGSVTTREANANLLAAAPTLLECLRETSMRLMMEHHHHSGPEAQAIWDIAQRARAAIAKATGGQS